MNPSVCNGVRCTRQERVGSPTPSCECFRVFVFPRSYALGLVAFKRSHVDRSLHPQQVHIREASQKGKTITGHPLIFGSKSLRSSDFGPDTSPITSTSFPPLSLGSSLVSTFLIIPVFSRTSSGKVRFRPCYGRWAEGGGQGSTEGFQGPPRGLLRLSQSSLFFRNGVIVSRQTSSIFQGSVVSKTAGTKLRSCRTENDAPLHFCGSLRSVLHDPNIARRL